jgi:hypothetical protein
MLNAGFRLLWDVVVAPDETRAADEVLARMAEGLRDCLGKNSDPALQEMYLCQPHHIMKQGLISVTGAYPNVCQVPVA